MTYEGKSADRRSKQITATVFATLAASAVVAAAVTWTTPEGAAQVASAPVEADHAGEIHETTLVLPHFVKEPVCGEGCASPAPVVVPGSVVTLHGYDGSINVTGTLQDFADGRYVLKTALGELRLPASEVQCKGDGCPDLVGVAITPTATSIVPHVEMSDLHAAGSEKAARHIVPVLDKGGANYMTAVLD